MLIISTRLLPEAVQRLMKEKSSCCREAKISALHSAQLAASLRMSPASQATATTTAPANPAGLELPKFPHRLHLLTNPNKKTTTTLHWTGTARSIVMVLLDIPHTRKERKATPRSFNSDWLNKRGPVEFVPPTWSGQPPAEIGSVQNYNKLFTAVLQITSNKKEKSKKRPKEGICNVIVSIKRAQLGNFIIVKNNSAINIVANGSLLISNLIPFPLNW